MAWVRRWLSRRRQWVAAVVLLAVVGNLYRFLWQNYAWLIVLKLELLSPSRSHCPVSAPPSPATVGAPRPARSRPLRVGLLLLFDDHILTRSLTRNSLANKRAYAKRHGYELVVVTGAGIDRSRPAAWSKIQAMRTHLPRFDYLCYFDADTLVMNPEVQLLDYAAQAPDKDVFISEDLNGLNTGVFMLRNSSWSQWFLREAWGGKGSEQEHMALHEHSRRGIAYPFEYEQRAFHYLFQTDVWTNRHLPRYTPSAPTPPGQADFWAHTLLLPQCALNSYMINPFNFRAPAESQWIPGDFVVHMAGHKDQNKEDLFAYCWKLARSRDEAGLAAVRHRTHRHLRVRATDDGRSVGLWHNRSAPKPNARA